MRFRAAISEPKTPSFCGFSGDLALSTRKSLAIAIVRFWCAKSVCEISKPLFSKSLSGTAFQTLVGLLRCPGTFRGLNRFGLRRWSGRFFSSKPKGPGEQGPPDFAPKSCSSKGPKWCCVPSIGVKGKSAPEIGQFLRRNFGMISGGPFLSRPLCFTAEY